MTPTIHASAILAGAHAVLIRGPSGSGKSRLALALLNAAPSLLPFARLIADDRVHAQAHHGRLLLRPAAKLEGLLEIRGIGIRKFAFEPVAVAGLVVDLDAPDAARMPADTALTAEIEGVELTRLPVAPGTDALPLVVEVLRGSRDAASLYKPA